MSGGIDGTQARLSSGNRIAAALGIFLVLEIAINFALAFYGSRGPGVLLFWLMPVLPIALLLFREPALRWGAAAAQVALILPAAMASETTAHLFGTCLY